MQPLIITIDGPAGTGKSTVAFGLAKRLGLEFLDTGAMYRALTACCLEQKIEPAADPQGTIAIAKTTELRFDWSCEPPKLLANGTDVTMQLRTPQVSAKVSDLAVIPDVRTVLVQIQQRIGRQHPRLVTEGRDQGSVVFPDAQFKFYLDADPETRAQRRVNQIRRGGGEVDHQQVLQNIIQRDHQDANRKQGPLVCPADAIRIDTSNLNATQVIDKLQQHIESHLKAGSKISLSSPLPPIVPTTSGSSKPEFR